jgi:hypothetical protein
MTENRRHAHQDDPRMYFSSSHFGQGNVAGQDRHEESVADHVEDCDFTFETKMYENGGDNSHEQAGRQAEPAPSMRTSQQECFDHCQHVHGVIDGFDNFTRDLFWIVQIFFHFFFLGPSIVDDVVDHIPNGPFIDGQYPVESKYSTYRQ